MKSVLISLDFVYNQQGKLVPVELNTNTDESISTFADITNDNFLETSDYFNHTGLDLFLKENSISKVKVIATRPNRFIKAFCDYYNYEHTLVKTTIGQEVIPEVDDAADTLIIRIAYDSFALIDDLYARDNYEFHNLIASESFATPVCFTENNFDTITQFEASQDGSAPNYVVKPRTPSYVKTDYPVIYKIDSQEQLETIKSNLTSNDFVTRFEYHPELSLSENRVTFLRSMDLIIGSELETLNLLNYKDVHSVAQDNENLIIDYTVDSNGVMHPLEAAKYYPTWETRVAASYHFDETDKVLLNDGTLKAFPDLRANDSGSIIKTITYPEDSIVLAESGPQIETNSVNVFTTGSSEIRSLNSVDKGVFVNITATNETFGEFTWHDGFGNGYFVDKHDDKNLVYFITAGEIVTGDEVYVFNKEADELIPLTVTDIKFDVKELDVYELTMEESPQFFTELDSTKGLYLVQHNSCFRSCNFYNFSVTCNYFGCQDCGKNSVDCIQCGGRANAYCDD